MQILYVSPVGTSILSNFVRDPRFKSVVEKYKDKRVFDWYRLPPGDSLNTVPDGYICSVVSGHELYEAIKKFVFSDPQRASAEINGVVSTANLFGHNLKDVEVLLYTTRTCTSRLCASIASETLKSVYNVKSVQVVEVKAFRSPDEFDEGLMEILDKVVRAVVNYRKRGYRVYVSATPGYKAETAFVALASILAGASAVTYIHESFGTAVTLPTPPITLDKQRLEEVTKIFREAECIDKGELISRGLDENRVRDYIELGILKVKGGKVCLRTWTKKILEIV